MIFHAADALNSSVKFVVTTKYLKNWCSRIIPFSTGLFDKSILSEHGSFTISLVKSGKFNFIINGSS